MINQKGLLEAAKKLHKITGGLTLSNKSMERIITAYLPHHESELEKKYRNFLKLLKNNLESGYFGSRSAVSAIKAFLEPFPMPTKCGFTRANSKPWNAIKCNKPIKWVRFVGDKPCEGLCDYHKNLDKNGVFTPYEQALSNYNKGE